MLCEFLAFLLSQHKRLRRCRLSIRFNLSCFLCIWGCISILWVKLLHKGVHLQPRENPQGIIIPSMGTSVPYSCIIVRVVNSENGSNSSLNLGSHTLNQPILIWVWTITFTKWEFAKHRVIIVLFKRSFKVGKTQLTCMFFLYT